MQSEKELIAAIAELTNEMREKYPEMSKYVGEMPVTNPNEEHPDVTVKKLREYYDSLLITMKRYAEGHEEAKRHEDKGDDNKL